MSIVWQDIILDSSTPENAWKDIFDSPTNNFDNKSWPIWEKMSEEEKVCYRFSRSGLEILEQAYIAKKKGWVADPEIWGKWEGWMIAWKTTNSFVPYVLLELEGWFSPSFLKYFNALK